MQPVVRHRTTGYGMANWHHAAYSTAPYHRLHDATWAFDATRALDAIMPSRHMMGTSCCHEAWGKAQRASGHMMPLEHFMPQ